MPLAPVSCDNADVINSDPTSAIKQSVFFTGSSFRRSELFSTKVQHLLLNDFHKGNKDPAHASPVAGNVKENGPVGNLMKLNETPHAALRMNGPETWGHPSRIETRSQAGCSRIGIPARVARKIMRTLAAQ